VAIAASIPGKDSHFASLQAFTIANREPIGLFQGQNNRAAAPHQVALHARWQAADSRHQDPGFRRNSGDFPRGCDGLILPDCGSVQPARNGRIILSKQLAWPQAVKITAASSRTLSNGEFS
jgi:hypothetical protein